MVTLRPPVVTVTLAFSPNRCASGHAFHTRAMTMPEHLGPFRAGPGGLPPYLAGRRSVQAACRAFVVEVRRGRPPPREIVFYGPRGNGKTALLVWLEKEAATHPGLDVVRLPDAWRGDRSPASRGDRQWTAGPHDSLRRPAFARAAYGVNVATSPRIEDERSRRRAISASSPNPATWLRRFARTAFSGTPCEARQLLAMPCVRRTSREKATGEINAAPAASTRLLVCSDLARAMVSPLRDPLPPSRRAGEAIRKDRRRQSVRSRPHATSPAT